MANPYILASDYNIVQEAITKILGDDIANNITDPQRATFGYGQPITSNKVIINNELVPIQASDYAKLKSDLLKIITHQGLEQNPNWTQGTLTSIPVLPTVQVGDFIIQDHITAFQNAIPVISDITNRFKVAPTQSSIESFTPDISQTRTTTWGSNSKPVIGHSFTIDFGTAQNARYFFNSGGNLRLSGSFTPRITSSQNTAWRNLLTDMGDVKFAANNTTASSGTGSAIGFYQLTTTPQQVFNKTGQGSYVAAYASNHYTVTVSCDISNNTVGGARYVYVNAYFSDDHTKPLNNQIKDTVDGTLVHTVKILRASGSNVAVLKPTASNTKLLTA